VFRRVIPRYFSALFFSPFLKIGQITPSFQSTVEFLFSPYSVHCSTIHSIGHDFAQSTIMTLIRILHGFLSYSRLCTKCAKSTTSSISHTFISVFHHFFVDLLKR
jgi:hypothetical protein